MENQTCIAVGKAHVLNCKVVRYHDNLAGHHCGCQHQREQQLFEGKFKAGKCVGCQCSEDHLRKYSNHTDDDGVLQVEQQRNLGKDRLIVFQRKMLWEQVQRVGHQLLLRLEREEQADNQGRNKDQP